MPADSSNAVPDAATPPAAARIRAAIEEEYESLLRSVAVLVARSNRHLPWAQVMEVASEVLQEAVQEALQHAGRFDPSRSATAWLRGIAARLLLSRRRGEARARRCVPAATLGHQAWTAALEQLCTASTEPASAGRLDLEQALAALPADQRQALELRYYRGLDGKELARALGVSTPGAARVRVYRALQALRACFRPAGEEVYP